MQKIEIDIGEADKNQALKFISTALQDLKKSKIDMALFNQQDMSDFNATDGKLLNCMIDSVRSQLRPKITGVAQAPDEVKAVFYYLNSISKTKVRRLVFEPNGSFAAHSISSEISCTEEQLLIILKILNNFRHSCRTEYKA